MVDLDLSARSVRTSEAKKDLISTVGMGEMLKKNDRWLGFEDVLVILARRIVCESCTLWIAFCRVLTVGIG